MFIFQFNVQETEKKNDSVVEVSIPLNSIHDILVEHQAQNFTSFRFQSFIEEKHREVLMQFATNTITMQCVEVV
jgi:hypothetical protein